MLHSFSIMYNWDQKSLGRQILIKNKEKEYNTVSTRFIFIQKMFA